jgi:hypothetical protein
MSRKYKFRNPSGVYFVSFATVYWMDIFTRQSYFTILEKAIDYCRAEKGMEVFAYCFYAGPSECLVKLKGNPL